MYQEIFKLHADLLKALAHPRRLEIVNLLKGQELSVSDLQEMLGLPQANLSQHLMLLRKHGVVEHRKEGKQVFYKVAHKNFVKACDLIRSILVERHDEGPLARELGMTMTEFVPIVTDPVCGMRLPAKSAATSHIHEDQRYYFCAMGCKQKFVKSPKRYILKTEHAYAAR
jgi:ArsR family transcriptional regulator, virulence genes transcriptional regulator